VIRNASRCFFAGCSTVMAAQTTCPCYALPLGRGDSQRLSFCNGSAAAESTTWQAILMRPCTASACNSDTQHTPLLLHPAARRQLAAHGIGILEDLSMHFLQRPACPILAKAVIDCTLISRACHELATRLTALTCPHCIQCSMWYFCQSTPSSLWTTSLSF
jgi:hypothetical protein